MNYFYFIYRIFFLLCGLFLPDIVKLVYCPIKRMNKNTYQCSYWSCKNYFTCYYNQKTLLDFKHRNNYHDILWYVINFIFIMIFTIIFTIIEVLVWQ